MIKIQVPKLKCKKCGHRWTPRINKVAICPKCKSAKWNERRTKEDWNNYVKEEDVKDE